MSKAQSSLTHAVYFTLKDRSEEARDALIEACHKYLTDHPGTLHYGAGPRATQYERAINDTDFDLALIMVFATDEDHQRYQNSQRHQEFLDQQLANCAQIRVFDSWA